MTPKNSPETNTYTEIWIVIALSGGHLGEFYFIFCTLIYNSSKHNHKLVLLLNIKSKILLEMH